MTLDENKAISRRWLEAGFGCGDTAVMEELIPLKLLQEGSLREQIVAYRAGFPDITVTIEQQIAEDDRVVSVLTFRGTHTGDLLGLPPTGKSMELTMVEIDTIRSGKVVDIWSDFHPIRVLQQLGLVVGKE